MTAIEAILEENRLVYASDSLPGIRRKRAGDKFDYFDKKERKIADEKILARIKKLVLPPAWENVWIAEKANAHLQATGIDQAGRKQYRYHPAWSESRNETKYGKLLEFGKMLPLIRARLSKDIRRKTFDECKVLAIAVSLMQRTNIRVGNESYKQLYGSYGLSTLRDKHVRFSGSKVRLVFKGKKGVAQDIEFKDTRLARLVKACRDIPGQELFQYYTPGGDRRSIGSGQVNRYLREITNCDFTAKDFRTWAGTLQAMKAYAGYEYPESETGKKKVTLAVLSEVASCLGNTRTVCKKYYVFPALTEAYEAGTLAPWLKKIKKNEALDGDKGLAADEKVLLSFLKGVRKERKKG